MSMGRSRVLCALVFGLLVLAADAAWQRAEAGVLPSVAEVRAWPPKGSLALVIGNADYKGAHRLASPANDVRLISNRLQGLGFEVTLATETTGPELTRVVKDFSRRLREASEDAGKVAIVYFAGHAALIDGADRLLGIDYDHAKKSGASLGIAEMAKELATDKFEKLIILDTYASTTQHVATSRWQSGGFATSALANTSFLFAAQPMGPTFDRTDGRTETGVSNSPLATALSEILESGAFAREIRRGVGESDSRPVWRQLYRLVVQDVVRLTKGIQVPWLVLTPEQIQYDRKVAQTRAALVYDDVSDPDATPVNHYEGSYALLIGASEYTEKKADGGPAWRNLPGVERDIAKVKQALGEVHGFEVTVAPSATSVGMSSAIAEFFDKHGGKKDARLLVYFAGHGFTTEDAGKKVGWLVPTDAPAADNPHLFKKKGISMRDIEKYSETYAAKHLLWVFDSCFSGAVLGMVKGRNGRPPVQSVFERKKLKGMVRRIIAAGTEGEVVPDESEFARLFVDALIGKHKNILHQQVLLSGRQLGSFLEDHVPDYVKQRHNRDQTPLTATFGFPRQEEGDIIFRLDPQLIGGQQ